MMLSYELCQLEDSLACEYLQADRRRLCAKADRAFAWLMLVHWVFVVAIALILTPRTWVGETAGLHVHVIAAAVIGGLISVPAAMLGFRRPGEVATRHVMAVAISLFSSLIIHLMSGRIEAHFHVFGALAFLAFYRDPILLLTAAAVVVVDHAGRGLFFPESIYGIVNASRFRWLEHAAWVVFELSVLIYGVRQSIREMRANAERRSRIHRQNVDLGRLSLLAEKTENAVVFTDANGLIVWVNAAFERVTGYQFVEIAGRKPGSFLQGERSDTATIADLRAAIAERRPIQRELINYSKSGDPYWVNLDIQPVEWSEGELGFVAIESDITARKEQEERLERARREAEEAARAKSQFLASMSHEIRTPLNGVIGTTDLLLAMGLTPQQRELAEITKSSGESLLAIVNDVLDLAKIDAGKLELEEIAFDLADLAESTASIMMPRARDKNIELITAIDPGLDTTVMGDPTRLRQVMLNLLSNAVKFTDEGSVELDARVLERDDEQIRIRLSIKDSGIGISESQIGRIFEAFRQADEATTRRYGGTGLGLSIVLELVKTMDGTIRVESEENVGSEFIVEIAFPIGEEIEPLDESNWMAGRRVLIVDDNATNRRVLSDYVKSWGMVPEVVDGPEEAEELLAADGEPFDVGLFDCKMAPYDGVELASRLAKRGGLKFPVILASSVNTEEYPPDAIERFHSVIAKPLRRSRTFDAIASAIGAEPRVEVAMAAADDRPAAVATPEELQELQVLVAEDNPTNQLIATRFLEKLGIEAQVVENGKLAVEAAQSEQFDVILMDCQMPVMDGYGATRAIRVDEIKSGRDPVRIVALTANAVTGDREKCLEAGMDDYLSKPLKFGDLEQILAEIASRRGERREYVLPPPAAAESDLSNSESGGSEPGGGASSVSETFDLAGLLGRTSHDVELASELIRCFAGDIENLRDQIEKAMLESSESVRRAAHQVKGAAMNCGAVAAGEAASALESAADERSVPATLRPEAESLYAALDRCHELADEAARGVLDGA